MRHEVCHPTAGEELRADAGNELALQGLRVRALSVLHRDVPRFDPTQKPREAAVAQQVRCLELPVDVHKRTTGLMRCNVTTTINMCQDISDLQGLQRHEAVKGPLRQRGELVP